MIMHKFIYKICNVHILIWYPMFEIIKYFIDLIEVNTLILKFILFMYMKPLNKLQRFGKNL